MKVFNIILGILIFFTVVNNLIIILTGQIFYLKNPIIEKIEPNIVATTIKPADYRWDEEGNLADIISQKYKPPKMESG